ncbi:MAG: hypothetical protein Q9190_002422 [Brigantiaea leucoxantha]
MGKSRSPTLIIAYLLSHPLPCYPQDPRSLLLTFQTTRSIVEPNPGFMDQLLLYDRMSCPSNLDSQPLYQRWCYQRRMEKYLAAGQAPAVEEIVFGDELPTSEDVKEQEESAFRCKRCRREVARSRDLVEHSRLESPLRNSKIEGRSSLGHKKGVTFAEGKSQACAHLFLDPLSWMREELAEGFLDGRLECPNGKCKQVLGRYAWQGMKCSCGQWVVPAITLARGKVDEVRIAGKDGKGG